jgi:hypothetical protein
LATPFRTVKGLVWAQNRRRWPIPLPFAAPHKRVFWKKGRFFPDNEKNHAALQQGNKTSVDEERRLPTWQMGPRARRSTAAMTEKRQRGRPGLRTPQMRLASKSREEESGA